MNKNEFMQYLEARISVLNKKEREDIIQEYSQHIDMKVRSGLTEYEAIKDFGDLREFVDEILEAYNIDPDYMSGDKAEYTQESPVHKAAGGIRKIADKLISALCFAPKQLKRLWLYSAERLKSLRPKEGTQTEENGLGKPKTGVFGRLLKCMSNFVKFIFHTAWRAVVFIFYISVLAGLGFLFVLLVPAIVFTAFTLVFLVTGYPAAGIFMVSVGFCLCTLTFGLIVFKLVFKRERREGI